MGSELGAANIRIGATIQALLQGMREASASVSITVYDINTRLADAYKRANKEQALFRAGLGKLSDDLSSLGGKLTTFATLPTLFAAGKSFKDFADLQKLEIGLKQYGESLKTVKELAKLPNVNVEGAAQSLVQLRAIGVESTLAQRGITAFANAITAAGKSSTDLQPALANIAQMLSTNVVSAADVKELANRIPQARKALIDAFGTASGEELTKIGVEKVVRGLIEQLEKIPKVGSGAGTAMEQFQDSLKFASASMGESIDRTFNLTENIKGLGDWVEKLTDGFKSLSPNVQDQIIKFGALVAVLGPTLIGVAQLIKLAPMLATGFSLIGGPITLVVAALAAFVVYYKDIIKLLESSAIKFVGLNTALKLNPLTTPFASSENSIASVTANGILAQNAKWRQEDRASERRALRGENERVKQLAEAQAEAQKLAAAQADALSKSLSGVGKAQKEATISGRPYQELLRKEREDMEAIQKIASGMKSLEGQGHVKVYDNNDPAFGSKLASDRAGSSFASAADGMKGTIEKIKQQAKEYQDTVNKIRDSTEQANYEINASIRDASVATASSFGELIGNLINGENAFGTFAGRIVSILGQLLKDIGKSLIQLGIGSTALKLFKDKPGLAIAAGIAMTAAGAAVANSAQKKVNTTRFAKGGFAYGEMAAIVGDNPNARTDPEMIAPYSKVHESIRRSIKESSSNRSGGGFIASAVIKGRDLMILVEEAQQTRKGLIGR